MELSRRRFLMSTLFGTGLLGLRSLATGIPLAILTNPRRAFARRRLKAPTNTAQYVIVSSSINGDPLNANVPGTYTSSQIAHPGGPSMAPTSLTLSGQSSIAALPWTQLPQALLNQLVFFHHGTYTVVHADEASVLSLGGVTANDAMFPSMLASQLAPALGTVQPAPIVLGPRPAAEDIVYQEEVEPIFSPASLATLLAPPTGPLGQLTQLRDSALNSLNAWAKSEGNGAQAAFIDNYVQSQAEARNLSESLLSSLATITDNSPASQVTAAVTLIRMNAAPVISINIPFGGDNHTDVGLVTEAAQTVAGVATIGQLWSQLVAAGIQNSVSFFSLNVFGRSLSTATSTNGRTHNANHHVAVMFGSPFQGSVIGGVEPVAGDFGAMSLDATTGAGVPGGAGDVPFSETMASMAQTFGTGVGVSPAFLAQNIAGGSTIAGALAAT